jgi:hypothetical protein
MRRRLQGWNCMQRCEGLCASWDKIREMLKAPSLHHLLSFAMSWFCFLAYAQKMNYSFQCLEIANRNAGIIKQVESNNLDKSRYQKIENQIRWRNEQRLNGIKSVLEIHQSIGSTWWGNISLWFCPIEVADDKIHELSSQSNATSNPPTYKTKCICTQKLQNEGFVLGKWRYLWSEENTISISWVWSVRGWY